MILLAYGRLFSLKKSIFRTTQVFLEMSRLLFDLPFFQLENHIIIKLMKTIKKLNSY